MSTPSASTIRNAAALALVLVCLPGCARSGEMPAAARAEIQINLCSEPERIVSALKLRAEGASPRRAWYFDTPGLSLHRRGLLFRLRLTAKAPELTLKVADQDCGRIAPDLVPKRDGKCEYDLHGEDMKGAVSISISLDERTADDLIAGRTSLAEVLSPAQVRYLRKATSAWPLPAGIERFGPARIQPYRAQGEPFVVEMWELPGGERYTEISRKASAADALRLRAALEQTLVRSGIAACQDQSSQAGAKLRAMAGSRNDTTDR
jgi:hypothetical protein